MNDMCACLGMKRMRLYVNDFSSLLVLTEVGFLTGGLCVA